MVDEKELIKRIQESIKELGTNPKGEAKPRVDQFGFPLPDNIPTSLPSPPNEKTFPPKK